MINKQDTVKMVNLKPAMLYNYRVRAISVASDGTRVKGAYFTAVSAGEESVRAFAEVKSSVASHSYCCTYGWLVR